jgi:cellulose synthase operon protein C
MSQPVVSYETAPWQVRIRRALDKRPVGGGMYCPDGHVVTCAHVVAKGAERPTDPVYVEFQHAAEHDPIPAVVVDGGWFPPSGEGGLRGDVAVLKLKGPVPAAAAAPPLRPSPEGMATAHSFHTYGYPIPHDLGGVPARGTIIGQAEFEWLSLQADRDGQGLDPGFSGSPVWDVDLGGVVGIIVLRDVPQSPGDRSRTAGPGNAYAIRMEVLGACWPALQPKVVRTLPADSESLEDLLEIGFTADGELPTVGETSVYAMGVTPSKYVSAENPRPSYVPRSKPDAQIRELLNADERFIVAVGDSKSGKSRSMAEMLQALRPGAQLIVPADGDPAALSKLARRPLPLHADGGVLWLDDIDRYLVPNGLDHKVLRSFLDREPRVTIAGTITSQRYRDITATRDAVGTREVRAARDSTAQFGRVLSQAKLVWVESRPNPEDLAAAQELYPGEDFQARGIGEQMVAAPIVEGEYYAARRGRPEGWAVVQAAIDWRRIGVSSPVSRSTLRSLFPSYLSEVAPHLEPDEELFARGVQWATDPLVGTIALLTTVEPARERATYRAFDYVLACADGQGPLEPVPVAPSAWDEAITSLGPDELLVVTQAAEIRGEADIARRAAEAARDSSDPAARASATLLLGELYAAVSDVDTAIKLLEEAAASGVSDVVPTAQADLGGLLSLPGGDPDRAQALLESAINAGDSQVSAQAKLTLGVLLMNQGHGSEARPLLEAAMAAHADLADAPFVGLSGQRIIERTRKERRVGRPRAGPAPGASPVADDRSRVLQAAAVRRADTVHQLAQANLGGLLVSEGDLTQARILLDAALRSNNPEVEPLARTNLGALLLRNGEVEAAEREFELALNSGPGVAPFAQISLGYVLAARGDTERGYALLEAVASDNIDQGPRALCMLGELHLANGELEAARSSLQRAVETGHRDWAPYANVYIAMIREQEGDPVGARELLEAVIAAKHPSESARAADVLGDILLNADDLGGAEDAYRRAINLGHSWWSAIATIDLAGVRVLQDAVGESAELLRSVVAGGDPNAAPMAADILGDLLQFQVGDPDGARAAYQAAIDSKHPDWTPAAQFDLAQLLETEGDLAGAEAQFRQITESPNRIYATKAWDLLGDLLAGSGDSAGARAAYQRAIDNDAPEWSAVARVDLARLILADTDDVDEAEPLLTGAVDSATPDVAASARLILGLIALYRDDRVRASEEFQRAADTGPPRVAGPALMQIAKLALDDNDLARAGEILEDLLDGPYEDDAGLEQHAAAYLGVVRLRQGDPGAALPLLQRGTASEDPDTAAYSYLNLGVLLFDLGDVDTAGEILERALDTGQPEVKNSVQAALGIVRVAQGRLDEANALLTASLDGGNEEDEPKVRRYLGSVMARQGRRDEARAVLKPLAASNDAEHRPAGLLLLGRLAVQDKNTADGSRWLTAAIDADDPEVETEARLELARLLAESADIKGSREVLAPLFDQPGDVPAQAEELLRELDAADRLAPPALPPGPSATAPPGAPVTAPEPPAQAPASPTAPSAPAATAPRLTPLPSVVLSALAEIAEAEGQRTEAEYWRGLLASARGTA